MYSENKKLVAVLGGRPYRDSLTLRRFLTPTVRKRLQQNKIDLIVATNNPIAASEFKQIKSLIVVETSEKLHTEFMNRQRETKPNLGAETRETINQYAIANGYTFVCHLDDNIEYMKYAISGKTKIASRNRVEVFYITMMLLFNVIENTNAGAVGIEMAQFPPSGELSISAGFPYSFFVHRVDENFKFENSTEDDILMSIYNAENTKPSCVIRNCIYYSKTGKKKARDGNRVTYNQMLKGNQRGEYISSIYPDIYSRKVTYSAKSSTTQKELMLTHKHTLKKPKQWDSMLQVDTKVHKDIQQAVQTIINLESKR